MVIAHDYLIQMGGAERVVAWMARAWPGCPIYTSVVQRDTLLPEFREADIRVSWMQRFPGIERHFKKFFAFYPFAFRSFAPIDAPVAWVSSSTFAKCLRFSPRTATILYCHSPTRFLWQADHYVDGEVRNALLGAAVRLLSVCLRKIDRDAARRFDVIVANSENVRERIGRCYGRDAVVVHPPVEIDRFRPGVRDDGFYLVVSRLVAYKGIHRAVQACTELGRRLVVVGAGPDRARLERMAGPTVEFLGHIPDAQVKDLMESCKALIFSGVEDFGIVPIEAQACGKPVLAFKGGGALETVIEGETGLFFDENERPLTAAIQALERAGKWSVDRIRANAERFSEAAFREQMDKVIDRAIRAKREALESVEAPVVAEAF
jgi:glycosyltransferase involved in cell wall biosynthesis